MESTVIKLKNWILPILLKWKRQISFTIKKTNILTCFRFRFLTEVMEELGNYHPKQLYVSVVVLLFKYSGLSTAMLVLLGFRSLKLLVIQPFMPLWQPFSNWLVLFALSDHCRWTLSTLSMFANSFTQRKVKSIHAKAFLNSVFAKGRVGEDWKPTTKNMSLEKKRNERQLVITGRH